MSVWQGAPVRDTPGGEGGWQTSLNVGETFTFLGETEEAERGGETREYSKVRLKGGSEGWVRSAFIANEATPAVVVRKAILHERPTPMASTDKVFQPMDVVAIVKDQDGWLQVRGKRRAATWLESGWVRPNAVSTQETDVAVAALRTKAMNQDTPSAQRKALKRVVDNPSLQETVFIDSLRAQLDTLARADTTSTP
jgi:uncharacterized protein YgiM (DUF1202 family)